MQERVFGDFSEEFTFDEESLDYVDGPLSGWLRRKNDGAWFAFTCRPIVSERLWHWVLVPNPEARGDPEEVIAAMARKKVGQWLSVVEDRRASAASVCRLVSLDCADVQPPVARSSST